MKAIPLFYTKLLCLIICVSCSNADNTALPDTTSAIHTNTIYEALDVPYGNAERQKLDLFQEFSNVAVVNMNYRLADAANKVFPMQIDDITSVVNFLKANTENYTISNTIGFIGVSAGAHLSLLWSYGFDTSNTVSMVGSIVGPTNFTDPNYQNSESPELLELLKVLGNDTSTAFLEQVSPFHQLTARAPATILFYGGQDPLVPTTQGIALRDKLQDLNITNQFTLYENAGHGWLGPELIDTWNKLKVFIENNL